MGQYVCSQCGAPIEAGATECRFCGEKFAVQQAVQQAPPTTGQPIQQNIYIQQQGLSAIDPSWPIKNKVVAGLLGIFLGGFGIHKFYLGKIGLGILYLAFCWTYIPAIVGFVEGIIYLCSNDENFQIKHHVRLK